LHPENIAVPGILIARLDAPIYYANALTVRERIKGLIAEINRSVNHPWVIMEICGGQTHSIMKNGLDQLLPDKIELVHGPGCPVCVTSLEMIDKSIAIASEPDVIFTSYGDMLRVPGSNRDLFSCRAFSLTSAVILPVIITGMLTTFFIASAK
jgi:hydrogenase expression/formation protein HypD